MTNEYIIKWIEEHSDLESLAKPLCLIIKENRTITLLEAINEMKSKSEIGIQLLKQYKIGLQYIGKINNGK